MAELDDIIASLRSGERSFDQVRDRLDRLIAARDQDLDELLFALHVSHATDPLPAEFFTALESRLNEASAAGRQAAAVEPEVVGDPHSPSTAPATASGSDAGETVIRPPREPGASTSAPASPDRAAPGGTVLRPRPPRRAAAAAASAEPPAAPDAAPEPAPPSERSEPRQLGPGSVIKDRFMLESLLGQGGMGTVYKARDRLKVEAKDHNPYVAVKILNEDFAERPEAFIALQREASKAQRLAHPNIGTVYDFDRDGSLVFMTMEFLEGQELKEYISTLPIGGLPVDRALPIVLDMAKALGYAHENGLIHSDFKPGNAFLRDDGRVNVIDFGIARASKTQASEGGEKTLFDPGDLGALTPAYATLEMFEGEDPHPSDDIYALGCVAYELLTGKHPYGKLPAPQARQQGLKPPPVDKLGKRQRLGLQRAVALERADRIQSIEEFLSYIRPRKSYTRQIVAVAIIALLVVGALSYNTVRVFLIEQQNQAMIAALAGADPQTMPGLLAGLEELEADSREVVANAAREAVLDYYQQRVEALTAIVGGRHGFVEADTLLDQASRYYRDSARLAEMRAALEGRRADLTADLARRFDAALSAGRLLSSAEAEGLDRVLAIAEEALPGSPLLSSPRLAEALDAHVRQAVAESRFEAAGALFDLADRYAVDTAQLVQIRDQVNDRLRRSERRRLAEAIRQRLPAPPAVATLEDLRPNLADLGALRFLAPDESLLAALDARLEELMSARLAQLAAEGQWQAAQSLLIAFAEGLRLEFVQALRRELGAAMAAAAPGTAPPAVELVALRQGFAGLLAEPAFDEDWQHALRRQHHRLVAADPAADGVSAELLERARDLYAERARSLREQGRLLAARNLVDDGLALFPGAEALGRQEADVRLAERERRLRLEAEARRVRIAGQQARLLQLAAEDEVEQAAADLQALRAELPDGDEFLRRTAPQAIAEAFRRLATRSAAARDYERAIERLNAGLALVPDDAALNADLAAHTRSRDVEALRRHFERASNVASASARRQLATLRQAYPEAYGEAAEGFGDILAERVRALEGRDLRRAHAMLAAARGLFADHRGLARIQLADIPGSSKYASQGLRAVEQGRLGEATRLLDQAKRSEASHADVATLATELEQRLDRSKALHQQFQVAMAAYEVERARPLIDQLVGLWSDNPDFQRDRERVASLQARLAAGSRLCRAGFAGYGKSARATCLDAFDGHRGPLLIVIPAGGAVAAPFALGKYEVTRAEVGAYCAATGACRRGAGDPELPMTGFDAEQIQGYLAWLSAGSGYAYRLPTVAEWQRAAQADGREGNDQYNCQLKLGGRLIKGQAMVKAVSGQPNRWGLVNYVGNARELVATETGFAVAGGAFEEPMSRCTTALVEGHRGRADALTGFRVLRALE